MASPAFEGSGDRVVPTFAAFEEDPATAVNPLAHAEGVDANTVGWTPPVPRTELDPLSEAGVGHEPVTDAEAEPEPESKVEPEPEVEAEPETEADHEAETPAAEAEPEPVAEPEHEAAEAEADVHAEPEPEVVEAELNEAPLADVDITDLRHPVDDAAESLVDDRDGREAGTEPASEAETEPVAEAESDTEAEPTTVTEAEVAASAAAAAVAARPENPWKEILNFRTPEGKIRWGKVAVAAGFVAVAATAAFFGVMAKFAPVGAEGGLAHVPGTGGEATPTPTPTGTEGGGVPPVDPGAGAGSGPGATPPAESPVSYTPGGSESLYSSYYDAYGSEAMNELRADLTDLGAGQPADAGTYINANGYEVPFYDANGLENPGGFTDNHDEVARALGLIK